MESARKKIAKVFKSPHDSTPMFFVGWLATLGIYGYLMFSSIDKKDWETMTYLLTIVILMVFWMYIYHYLNHSQMAGTFSILVFLLGMLIVVNFTNSWEYGYQRWESALAAMPLAWFLYISHVSFYDGRTENTKMSQQSQNIIKLEDN